MKARERRRRDQAIRNARASLAMARDALDRTSTTGALIHAENCTRHALEQLADAIEITEGDRRRPRLELTTPAERAE